MMDYQDFLRQKHVRQKPAGFEAGELPANLWDWQHKVVRWNCRLGRSAIFSQCGTGKSRLQLAWANQCHKHAGGMGLILAPLCVGPQTVEEARIIGIEARVVGKQEDCRDGINITNYQKLLSGRFNLSKFTFIVCDESNILSNYMGTTKRYLIEHGQGISYRLCCSATPSPNDHMELGNHAEFLGIMPSNEMLSRWFINDPAHVGHYRLKEHGKEDFWRWMASWAITFDSPVDLGYPIGGFELPELRMHQHIAEVDFTRDTDGKLIRCGSLTATTIHKEMRLTAEDRAAVVAELVKTPGQWIVWINTDYEADAVKALIPDVVEIHGGEKDHIVEKKLQNFLSGKTRVLLGKSSQLGFGLNIQCCHQVAYVGLSYSHMQFYQSLRRCWRFGQKHPVDCHVVIAETEGEVLATLQRKERQLQEQRSYMIAAAKENLFGMERNLQVMEHQAASGKNWTMHLGDSVEVIKGIPDGSVDFTIFSPPFSSLYIYSDSIADMGNSDDEEFFQHFRYIIPDLLRVTVPGRLCAVHCKDLPKYAGRDGIAGLKDFPGQIIAAMESGGWSYHSRVTIWKCPVVERERTNSNGLLHKTVLRDSSQIRQGMADYLLIFRKFPREENGLMSDKPIARPFDRWVGDENLDPRQPRQHPSPHARKKIPSDQSIALWQRYAEPVWWDIDMMDVLNYEMARSAEDERHICPLQCGLIRRAIYLWSLPGETIFSPFAGVGSEGVVALEEDRKFQGIELKEGYWRTAQRFLTAVEERGKQGDLFAEVPEEADQ